MIYTKRISKNSPRVEYSHVNGLYSKGIFRTFSELSSVGAPRIELGPHVPKTCILPIYYTPIFELS